MDTENTEPTVDDFLIPDEGAGADPIVEPTDEPVLDASDLIDTDDEPVEEVAEDEPGEADEPAEEAPKIDPPHSWSKDEKDAFAKLPPEHQTIIARRESERDKFVQQKSVEAAQTRDRVANEARDIIVRMHEDHAQKLTAYAQMFTPQQPDQRLLYSQNPDDVTLYHRQKAAFDAGVDQQQQLHQQIAQAQAAANSAREQSQQVERASDAQRLQDQLPEWFDPSSGPKLKQELQSIGAELGYPTELMAEASSTDIIALKKAAEWKADAEKYRALIGKKMEAVRAAKNLPRMTRPGAAPSKGQATAKTADRREQALESFGQTRSGDAAAALLLQRTR